MKTAYLDCFSGISGDMFLGALLDAGLPFEELENALRAILPDGYTLQMKREKRNSLSGTRFIVNLDGGKHENRSLLEIREIIEGGDLSKTIKDKSIQIFETLAEVEGKIHNRSPEEVHFHEVGAVDSIIDIVGTVFGVDFLGIKSISASALPLGSGFVKTQHGRIPIPAPATIALLKDISVYDSGLKYEMITPTGAVLVKSLSSSFGSMPPMIAERVGYGVGKRELPDRPNLLRIIIGDEHHDKNVETVVLLEANLDDINPEWLGFLMDRLYKAGALDVAFSPIQMKKNRPGVQIQVMGKPQQKDDLMDILFSESTTLGVRFRYNQRKILKRSQVEIDSPWGKMKAKKVDRPNGTSVFLPEYEACREIAEENGVPLQEVYYRILSMNRG